MRSLWDDVIRSRAFWLSSVTADVDLAGWASLRDDKRRLSGEPACGAQLRLKFPSGYRLLFEVWDGVHAMQLHGPYPFEPVELGTRDDAHSMPDLLRWPEFAMLTRALRRQVRPAWAAELLFLHYVAVTDECAGEYRSSLRDCLSRSDVFSDAEVEYLTARAAVREDFRWVENPELGWVAEGRDACGSIRNAQAGFNFSAFRSFLAAVEHAE